MIYIAEDKLCSFTLIAIRIKAHFYVFIIQCLLEVFYQDKELKGFVLTVTNPSYASPVVNVKIVTSVT